ncbi:uncharacterized protein [Argopecten irradians]|uniref:uncharacterized protein n=1 Tax=Argopecten irradians TaxID=31199 RepID=UPI0037141D98
MAAIREEVGGHQISLIKQSYFPKNVLSKAKSSKWSKRKLGDGLKKLLGYWSWLLGKRKKRKEKRETKDKTRKIFDFKCLRRDETDLHDKKERYERRNKTGNTQSDATTSAVVRGPDSNQVILHVKTCPFLHDELCFSDTNSFIDVHFGSLLSLSSFHDQFEGEQNTVVSRTVEADGIRLENYEEDEKSEETLVKEVVSAPKQSASIQLKSSTLQRRKGLYFPSCTAVQCTEDVGEYNPIPHSSPRMESLASENSSESCRKHNNVAIIKPLIIKNLSSRCSKVHAEPQVTTAPIYSQDTSPNDKESMKLDKSEMDNSTESNNLSKFRDMDRGDFKDKLQLKEGSISKKQEVTKLRPGSFEDFVFQKDKSKSSVLMNSNLQPCCSFAETVTCYNCSTYGCTTAGSGLVPALSVNQHRKSSPLSSKRQAEEPSILLKELFKMFLIWLSWSVQFLKEEQVKESKCRKVSALTQHETSSVSEENLKQVETTPDSKQKEPNLLDGSQLLHDAVPVSDLNSSDVIEPLQVYVPPVGHLNPVNLDKLLSYRCLNTEQPHSRSAPSKSKQNPGLRKKKKHLPCRRSTLKPFVQLHTNLKSRTSRRHAKKVNSLENFVFQRKNSEKNCKHGRRNYLNGFLDVRSYLDVFMFPYNRPNGMPATTTNGTTGAEGETLGVTASRLSINERPPTTVNRDVNVFEQITAGTVTQSMRFEWARFKSFWSFPLSCPIAPTALAKYGFYYTGNEDKVCCFCCGVTHGNWQKGESVYAVHYTISKTCRFMRGDDVGNVPIHGTHSALNQRVGNEETVSVPTAEERELTSLLQTPDSVTSILLGRERDQGNLASLTPSVPDLRETPNRFGGGSLQNGTDIRNVFRGASNLQTTQTSNASSSSASRTNTQQPLTPSSVPSQTTTQTAQVSDPQRTSAAPNTSSVSQSAVSQPNQVARQSQMDTIANQQRQPNQQQPSTLAQRQHQQQQQNQGVGGADNGNLGVNTTRPRYPNYAVLTVRSSTFHGFPNHLDQTPIQMAKAGFFYAGYGDYVRCFFCGGGLRNWEPGDDPWVEHARWFPRCVYVKQNKGQPFINMVLQRQRELTLPNEYIRTTSGDSTTTSTARVQTASIMENQSGSIRDTTPVNDPTTTSTANTETRPMATIQQQTRPSVTDEEMTSPAVLSIREMGYSNDVIKAAIQQLRRNQGPVPLSAEALVEIIFGLGDDIPPERPNETQTGQSITQAPRTGTPPSIESLSSGSNTSEPQTEAATSEPRSPHRPRGGEASSRAYTEEELKSIQDENNQLKEQMKCKICMDNLVCISFLPCGHLCCCAECAPAMVKCPICRQIIRGSVRTYLS